MEDFTIAVKFYHSEVNNGIDGKFWKFGARKFFH